VGFGINYSDTFKNALARFSSNYHYALPTILYIYIYLYNIVSATYAVSFLFVIYPPGYGTWTVNTPFFLNTICFLKFIYKELSWMLYYVLRELISSVYIWITQTVREVSWISWTLYIWNIILKNKKNEHVSL